MNDILEKMVVQEDYFLTEQSERIRAAKVGTWDDLQSQWIATGLGRLGAAYCRGDGIERTWGINAPGLVMESMHLGLQLDPEVAVMAAISPFGLQLWFLHTPL